MSKIDFSNGISSIEMWEIIKEFANQHHGMQSGYCIYCDQYVGEDHLPSCLWRKAKELVLRNENNLA